MQKRITCGYTLYANMNKETAGTSVLKCTGFGCFAVTRDRGYSIEKVHRFAQERTFPILGGIVASFFSTLRKKQRGPEGASNMVPQRGRPLWTPPAPPRRGIGGGAHPTSASHGRAATRWVLSLLVRGLAAPPDRQERRPAVGIGCDRSIANNWHERFIHEKSRLR